MAVEYSSSANRPLRVCQLDVMDQNVLVRMIVIIEFCNKGEKVVEGRLLHNILSTYGIILLLSMVFNSYVSAVTGVGAAAAAAVAATLSSAAVSAATFASKFCMSASGIGDARKVS